MIIVTPHILLIVNSVSDPVDCTKPDKNVNIVQFTVTFAVSLQIYSGIRVPKFIRIGHGFTKLLRT